MKKLARWIITLESFAVGFFLGQQNWLFLAIASGLFIADLVIYNVWKRRRYL